MAFPLHMGLTYRTDRVLRRQLTAPSGRVSSQAPLSYAGPARVGLKGSLIAACSDDMPVSPCMPHTRPAVCWKLPCSEPRLPWVGQRRDLGPLGRRQTVTGKRLQIKHAQTMRFEGPDHAHPAFSSMIFCFRSSSSCQDRYFC